MGFACVILLKPVVRGLRPDLDGQRIVQICDLHVGRNIRRNHIQRVVERAQRLASDLVALTELSHASQRASASR